MAIVPYPKTVPKPLISVSRTQAQTFQLVQPLRGPGYVKRLNNDAPVTYELNWRLSRDQSAQLQTWFYSMSESGLAMGRNQFQLELDTEWGKLLHTLQITPETFAQNQEAHNVFSYQAVAIARKVPIPQWWFDHEDLVNSEFFAQRGLFDLVMNQQLPSAYGDNVIAFIDASKKSINGIELSRSSPATYIDTSGAIRTAVANEPRYEGGGLLVESGSTNIMVNSSAAFDIASLSSMPSVGGWFRLSDATQQTGGGIQFRAGSSSLTWPPSLDSVISVMARGSGDVSLATSIYSAFSQGKTATFNLTQMTTSSPDGSIRKISNDLYIISLKVKTAQTASSSTYRGVYVNIAGGNVSIETNYAQLEAGDYASSRIIATGGFVDRSSDIITLQVQGAKRVYREYTPLGSNTQIAETVPYTGELCPPGSIRLLKVLND